MKKKTVPFGISAQYAAVAENYIVNTLGLEDRYNDALNNISLKRASTYMPNATAPEDTIVAFHLSDASELVKTKLAAAQAVLDGLPAEKAKRAKTYINNMAHGNLFSENASLTDIADKTEKRGLLSTFKSVAKMIVRDVDVRIAVREIHDTVHYSSSAGKQARANADLSMRMPLF